MIGIDDAITAASKLFDDAINKIWPNPTDEAQAKVLLIKATADAALVQLQQEMSVMLAEAQSTDKWTSRARPSFLYVIYTLILVGIPMGALYAFNPTMASHIATGFQQWLAAIPDSLWQAFSFGYIGYSASRTFEKIKGVGK